MVEPKHSNINFCAVLKPCRPKSSGSAYMRRSRRRRRFFQQPLLRHVSVRIDSSLSLTYSGALHPSSASVNGSLSLDVLKKACFDRLSNPNDLHDESLLLPDWIGHIADNCLFSLFFSSALAALWESLIQRAHWIRYTNAFETLIEVSASSNHYQWIRSTGSLYLLIAIRMGSERAPGVARHLLRLGVSPN